ncbi:molybdenum cofactor guanylyltransferase [Francisella sp. 19X1-34]|uniref:molybdenum cofactor guanylyltransferase n=1 Tax=Francisella sp. 19X1-34 TaxID=3087177 RepID=UPI002E372997|nr:molybdenum cofactor guanylyltransferase [Francisella sp. 19X1-34]MED7789123.1 molybdenum cofactor guanylyltransferase [Francisella sp. 19X1-34]
MSILTNCVGIVLAGGLSSRMGKDKSCLALNGKTFLQRSYETLYSALGKHVYISGNHKRYRCLVDKYPKSGPASAILGISNHLLDKGYEKAVIVPVDMPYIEKSTIIKGFEHLAELDTKSVIFNNYFLPCWLDIKSLNQVNTTIKSSQNISMKKLLFGNMECISVQSKNISAKTFINVNTPDDFSMLSGEKTNEFKTL